MLLKLYWDVHTCRHPNKQKNCDTTVIDIGYTCKIIASNCVKGRNVMTHTTLILTFAKLTADAVSWHTLSG